MTDNGIRLRVDDSVWTGLALYGFVVKPSGEPGGRILPATVQTGIDEGVRFDPICTLSRTAAKVLMDDLWRAGIRPTDAVSGDATTEATRKHLDDMRKLVAHYSKCGL